MTESIPRGEPNPYEYSEFRSYFSAYLEYLKSQSSKYSLRWIAKRLDLKSHAHLVRIADGTRIPTPEFVDRFAAFAGLHAEQLAYLKLLISAQNAKTNDEKEFILGKASHARRELPAQAIKPKTFDMISDWYLIAIMELSMVEGFRDDASWIASKLRNDVTEDMVKTALSKLESVELLKRSQDGHLRRNVNGLLVENKSPSESIRNFHRQMLINAEKTLDDVPQSERLFLSQTFRFNPKRMAEAEDLIVEFRRKIQVLLAKGDEDEVYHLAIQFFPLTRSKSK